MFKCDPGNRVLYEAGYYDDNSGVTVSVGDTVINTTINIGASYSYSNSTITTNTFYVENQPKLRRVYRRVK